MEMTREEVIKQITDILEYFNDRIEKETDPTFDKEIAKKDAEALRMAIKVLEQEPILDKIRSEIEDAAERFNMRPEISYDTAYSDGLYRALSIIDKYREQQAEREE